MSGATLVVELFTEELPPKALKRLGEAFADGIVAGLAERGFTTAASVVKPFATPRRLAVSITGVLETSADQPVVEKLMPASVAFDATGKATVALQRRLDKAGRTHLAALGPNAAAGPDRLTIESDGKVDAVFLRSIARGSALQVGLQSALEDTLEQLPIPKVMSYSSHGAYYNDAKFVRWPRGTLAAFGACGLVVSSGGLGSVHARKPSKII